ncbi:LITAF-like zinc ribbon domain-containing protein [Piptocephalis cylindrospora]|uniref:LITAF-like zinc ribbon domain-containing protein n=1 Tax=Piptocephalis cylindrospora TaxID=1907219 RepID=A0A4P9Y3C9_9FUNG|nr:LITAF-like zinc ribbon domain-containing protein [Piptocephalis cylindrospora]|eukprot:RKP13438.1 LITAF-like zinc ribbon domain-containing protein [Piptocephalis cylindrospora]
MSQTEKFTASQSGIPAQTSEVENSNAAPAVSFPVPHTEGHPSDSAASPMSPPTAPIGEAAPPTYSPQDQNSPQRAHNQQGTAPGQPDPVPVIHDRIPIPMPCPHCKVTVTTQVKKEVGAMAGCFACLCCLICWPCFWVPLVAGPFRDDVHQCPHCMRVLAIRKA